MGQSSILGKIKKLLALGNSPNANEAAAAFKRARELMDEYGISEEEVSFADVQEKTIQRSRWSIPPRYEAILASTIAKAFGVRLLYCGNGWTFIGFDHRLEIAMYVGTVLLRKLAGARAAYMATLYRCKRATKTRRADEFCLGWVSAVISKVSDFVGTEQEKALLDHYMTRYADAHTLAPIDRVGEKLGARNDFYHGSIKGEGVDLRHGVQGEARQTLLESE
ncbi:MAG: hypothetical protein A2Y38_20210 [Spirochaetes bacterium GWB1_59_5]|nr:MAG: hypothetical protein A2Y38_20210 [Spirochaetes bacterium GWB1_59_5]